MSKEQRTIRFATIGSGAIVESLLKGAFNDSRFSLTAVYSRTEERGREFASKLGVSKVYTSLQALAQDPEIDAVYIASPNSCHCSQSVLMMNHGKHVLCEKPLASSEKEAELMVETAKRNNVALMEAMKTTLLPNFFALRDALPKIGKVRRFSATFCQYSSRYEKFLKGELTNVFDTKMKGGALLDLGVYGIAPLIHLFGEPTSVSKSEVRMIPGGVISQEGVDVMGTLLLSYPEMDATIAYSKISDSYLPLEIQGEKGSIIVNKLSQMHYPYIKYKQTTKLRRPGEPSLLQDECEQEDISVPTITENMYYEVKEFIDVILSGRIESENNTFERSLAVLRVCDSA